MTRFPCDVVTFDCYGPLIDWEGGIADAFAREARRLDRAAPREDVIAAYHAVEPEIEGEAYRPYREVLARAAEGVARRLGWGEVDGGFLAESLRSWLPFPDTNPALERLEKARLRLGILSTMDDDVPAGTRGPLSARFDPIVTAQQVRSYKPAPGHFEEARRRLGSGVRWLHAAQSYFHDVVPAKALRIPVAWINRKAESAG